jgi:predicted nucleic acid-binding protein
VAAYKVSGKNTHDARLVASMRAHGIAGILTFNVQDFARYEEIEALHPDSVAVDFAS